MNANAEKWVAALESGEFTQGYGQLRGDGRYCCLGVACELYRRELGRGRWAEDFSAFDDYESAFMDANGDNSPTSLPKGVMEWLGITTHEGWFTDSEGRSTLAVVNDSGDVPFQEIAAIIRSEPEGLFV